MGKGRLEAFSDGVIAIIITIMVLELKVPHGADLEALEPMIPVFLSYVLSFAIVGIYWNNHHHLLHATKHVTARIMWMNLLLLFWLSLIPAVTGWVGENPRASWPAALYAVVLFASAIAYWVLQRVIIREGGVSAALIAEFGRDVKGKLSLLLYASAIGLAFVHPWIADGIFLVVALVWFVPDPRIARSTGAEHP